MEGQLKVCLVGGPPWGFRLGGGRELNIPLAVAKLRKQSVAWRAGLCENDEVLAINGVPCGTLTHTQAMQLVDYGGDYLEFLIKRTTDVEGLLHEQAVPHLSSTQKTNDYSINTGGKVMITQARQYPSQDPSSTWPGKVETSHCTDGVGVTSVSVQLTKPANDGTPPKVEYGPEGVSLQLNVPCNEISADVPESTPMAAEPPIRPFLSGGIPAEMNMDEEELIATYRERAKQAKLHRSESLAEKQQREMRRRCETIASSLASPGSSAAEYGAESKGAALFRKRRRRVKHYTLISYGTASDGVPGEEGVEYEEGDEDDDREEEGEEVNWGSQEDLFTGCNEWDHLEKGSVEQETNSAIDPGLGKGAKMFERRRQRLEELGKETSQHWVSEGKNVEDKSVMAVQNHPQLNGGTTYTSPMNAMPFGRASDPPKQSVTSIKVQSTTHSSNAFKSKELLNGHSSMTASPTMHQSHAINGFPPSEADSQSRSTAVLNRSPRPFMPGGFGSVSRPSTKAVEPYVLTMLTPDATVASAIPKTNFNRYPAAYPGRSKDINIASESIINKTDLETPARGPAQRPAILLPVGQSLMNRESETQHAPQPTTPNTENLPPREQRISIPAVHAGTLQEATKRPKQNVYNFSEGVKASQNSEQQKAMQKRGFESCPEEDFLSLGAEACNFLRAEKMRSPPPIAPKPARPGSASDVSPPITLEGRGGALFARCRNRSDHFVVDSPQNESGATVLASHSTSAAQASEETWQPTANVRSLNLSGKTKSATCSEVLVSASPQQSSPRPVPFQATMATSIQFAREQPNSGAPPAPSADTTKEASWRPVSASGSTSSKGQATFYVRKLGLQSQVPFSFPKRSGNNLCETDDDTRSEPAAWVSPALSPVPSSPNLPCRSLHTRLARSVTEAARRKTLSGPSAAWRQSGVQRSSSFSTDNSCASCPNNSLSWQWHGTGPRRVQTGGLTSKASKQQVYNVRPQGWRGLAR